MVSRWELPDDYMPTAEVASLIEDDARRQAYTDVAHRLLALYDAGVTKRKLLDFIAAIELDALR